jgi:hypothetical protein
VTFTPPEPTYQPVLQHPVVGVLIAAGFALTAVAIAVLVR